MEDWGAVRDRLLHDTRSRIVDRKRHMADIRAALARDDEVKRLVDMAGDWIETDPSLRSTACIEVALDHAKELDAEGAALRQRVEELEDEIEMDGGSWRVRAEAAEAKLARVMALHEALLNTLAPSKSTWIQHVWRNAKAALAAAKGE